MTKYKGKIVGNKKALKGTAIGSFMKSLDKKSINYKVTIFEIPKK